jgi:hypothetical protein
MPHAPVGAKKGINNNNIPTTGKYKQLKRYVADLHTLQTTSTH